MYDRDGRWIGVRCYQRGAVDQHIDVFVVSLNPDDNPFARTPSLIRSPGRSIKLLSVLRNTKLLWAGCSRLVQIPFVQLWSVISAKTISRRVLAGSRIVRNFALVTSWLKSTTSALESGVMGRSRLATTVMSASRNTFLLFRTMSTIALAKSGLYDDWSQIRHTRRSVRKSQSR